MCDFRAEVVDWINYRLMDPLRWQLFCSGTGMFPPIPVFPIHHVRMWRHVLWVFVSDVRCHIQHEMNSPCTYFVEWFELQVRAPLHTLHATQRVTLVGDRDIRCFSHAYYCWFLNRCLSCSWETICMRSSSAALYICHLFITSARPQEADTLLTTDESVTLSIPLCCIGLTYFWVSHHKWGCS